jgi:superfamily II DNA/RNA helicase
MIELGFEEDVKFILDSFSQHNQINRVTHLYSATMPARVERLAKNYLRQYCFISIGDPGQAKKDI